MEAPVTEHRELCLTCRRPRLVCWCDAVTKVPSKTHVVFIQHPREFRVPVSTCRMAHLSLPNSELHVALTATGTPALEAVCARPGTAVLFPTEDALDADSIEVPPETLVVIDGTWSNARKVVINCPLLSKLPRVAFRPDAPSRYRIRAEPDDAFVSTIEATAIVLEKLERAPGRFRPILTAFDAMVERQLDYANSNEHQTRHVRAKKRNSVRVDPLAGLKAASGSLVAVFGESNAWPMDALNAPAGEPELLQLVAQRLSTGERFEATLRPTRPLAPNVPMHLDLPAQTLMQADAREAVFARWRTFVKPGDVFVGWGRYCHDLLALEGHAVDAFIDVRASLCQLHAGRPGSVEACAGRLGIALPEGRGRAVRRLEATVSVTRAALEGRATDALAPTHAREGR
ncbi:MAG: tRNA-uridine aminocarboxypropyltransferase [Myxococcales bacterium]|nr:tRNA-uridine aminocarboxypropyltransferase [Myxococcales bacterium]MDP3502103.1 tRNA-uridine aminocarboxypropyltransferase [Myxococcales bacterium]